MILRSPQSQSGKFICENRAFVAWGGWRRDGGTPGHCEWDFRNPWPSGGSGWAMRGFARRPTAGRTLRGP